MIGHPFVALHFAGLYASAGDLAGLRRCEQVVIGKPEGAYRDVSLTLIALLEGEAAQAAQTLAELPREARVGIGGSNVDRILVDLIERRCTVTH